MVTGIKYEDKRLTLQAKLDTARPRAERNRLGQFATPTGLAMDMLAYARKIMPARPKVRFLDPGFGTGSFYSALVRSFPATQIATAKGFEIDHYYGKPALDLWDGMPLKLQLADFTRTKPPTTEAERFNLVICNPPYVRHHHIDNGEKLRLQHLTEQACGVRITGLAGLYCYFLGLSHAWMAADGVAGWLLPSEFMDVKYGIPVKQYLLSHVTLLQIHRFDPSEVQFEDALVSSVIVWFRKAKPAVDHKVRFTFGGTLMSPKVTRMVPASVLQYEPKWTRFPHAEVREPVSSLSLGDFFTIRRGLATGGNSFFILTRDQIDSRGLPMEFFRPILPSPRHLRQDEILADKNGNPLLEDQLFLLDCNLSEEHIKARYPALWEYLESGMSRGLNERYLCKHRSPWYVQEKRQPSSFICTYMGRGNVKSGRPFRFILNRSKATVSNVYLLMYPKPLLAQVLRTKPDLSREIWQALNRISPTIMLEEGRVYGGGLHKLEPNELGNVPADTIMTFIPPMTKTPFSQLDLFMQTGT